jgi:hypothetical protein
MSWTVVQRALANNISPTDAQSGDRLAELRAAYMTMTEAERKAEVAWAEEGLQGQPPPGVEFPDESDAPWDAIGLSTTLSYLAQPSRPADAPPCRPGRQR